MAVASISTLVWPSTSATTCTSVMAWKCRPSTQHAAVGAADVAQAHTPQTPATHAYADPLRSTCPSPGNGIW